MIIHTMPVGEMQTNAYIITDEATQEAIVVDPGGDAERILAYIENNGLQLVEIVLTHYHFDHTGAVQALMQALDVPLTIHSLDSPHLEQPPRFLAPYSPSGLSATRQIEDGDTIRIGNDQAVALHTPGHSPGGISLWFSDVPAVVCGDTLFREGIGRSDLPGGDQGTLAQSIRHILYQLPDETTVYPGHGPSSTIGHEKRRNPWVRA